MLFLIILILSIACIFFPTWWMIAIICFICAFIWGKTSVNSFWSGFAAVFIGWVTLALYKSIPNENLLASRVIQLFPLPHNWLYLLLFTGLIGGSVGGLSAYSGFSFRQSWKKKFYD
jgi:hypothetical protein